MRLRFLCLNHRNWLATDSAAANDCWLRNSDLARRFLTDQHYIKAVNHAGSAFEVAELLILVHARISAADINRFTDSAVLLCQSLMRSGQSRFVRGVIDGAIVRLNGLLAGGVERKIVLGGRDRLLCLSEYTDLPDFQGEGQQCGLAATDVAQRTLH
jgi:hypothetical protein